MSSNEVSLQSNKQLSCFSPSLNFSSLVEVKLDVQVIQTALSQALSEMNNRINSIHVKTLEREKQTLQRLNYFDNRLHQQNQKSNYIQEFVDQHQKKIMQHQGRFETLKFDQSFIEDIRRKQIELQSSKKQGGMTYSKQKKPNADFNNVNQKHQQKNSANNETQNTKKSDAKIYEDSGVDTAENGGNQGALRIYSQPIRKIDEAQYYNILNELEKKFEQKIENLQKNIYQQIQQVKLNMGNMIIDQATKGAFSTKNLLKSKSRISLNQQHSKKEDAIKEDTHQTINNEEQNLAISALEDKLEEIMDEIDRKFNVFIQVNVQQIKNQIFNKMGQLSDMQANKIEENSKTASVITDHVLALKTKIEDLRTKHGENKLEIKALNDKSTGLESQIFLLKEASKISRENFESLCQKLGKLEFISERNQNENLNSSTDLINENLRINTNEQQQNQQLKKNSKQRVSGQSIRNSVIGGRQSVLTNNLNNININGDSLEEMVRKINQKLINLTDRFNRYEDEKKSFGNSSGGKSSFLPKIEGKGSNTPSFDIVKSQLKKLNDELIKTNERLQATKGKLSNLYDAHNLLPLQIEDLYKKLQQHSQFQEDRLLQLIKELINRCLTDPFNNNFTNTLKREINVKFLEIKHQYYGILKEIEAKVEDRAEVKQIQKIKDKSQQGLLQVKSIIQKKCDNDDFKKGFKYLENKLKEVYTFVKAQAQINQQKNQNKCYVNLKKQH